MTRSGPRFRELFPGLKSEPVSYLNVTMSDSFWAPRQRATRDVTVAWLSAALDPAGGLDALRASPRDYAARTQPGEMEHVKAIEAMATVIGVHPDPDVERLIDEWGGRLIDAQAPDGYLAEDYPVSLSRPPERWQVRRGWNSHEDYLIGHYIESAIAHLEATGKRALYESAVRAADNMCDALLDSERAYAPGHPEIEQALMRLYAFNGERRYLRLCGWLLGQRGNHRGRASYGRTTQDHLPVVDQRTVEGHSVCAAYLFNGATLFAGATGDAAYRKASLAAWEDLTKNKLFIHGGAGNLSARNEGYGDGCSGLAPDDCFGESCASYANFRWAHNLFALTGEARHLDVAERILYNAFAASLSLSGDRSLYTNPLQTGLPGGATGAVLLAGSQPRDSVRLAEYASSCCPPNIVKLINTVGGFQYATDDSGIFVKHYGSSRAEIDLGPGVVLTQKTDYPWSGDVEIFVDPVAPTRFALRLRVPHWATDCRTAVNGEPAGAEAGPGWLEIERTWSQGDRLELSLGMDVRRVTASGPRGYENRAALLRGPIVYCLEELDLGPSPASGAAGVDVIPDPFPRSAVSASYIPEDERYRAEHRSSFLGGVTVLTGKVREVRMEADSWDFERSATFVPYAVWGNRKPSEMRVWLGAHSAPPQIFLSQQIAGLPTDGDDWA